MSQSRIIDFISGRKVWSPSTYLYLNTFTHSLTFHLLLTYSLMLNHDPSLPFEIPNWLQFSPAHMAWVVIVFNEWYEDG